MEWKRIFTFFGSPSKLLNIFSRLRDGEKDIKEAALGLNAKPETDTT